MAKLKDIGEFGFIKHFSENFKKNLPEGFEGIGDDCAVMPYTDDEVLLITTDMLVEKQHFLPEKISPFELGYKSLAVNLSDIAAMGGSPVSAFLSIGIHPETDVEWLDEFFKGIKSLADESGTLLLGGDTTKVHENAAINIAVIGKCSKRNVKRRTGAVAGDKIVVTGFLGDSGGGLNALKQNLSPSNDIQYLIDQHHKPRPHLKEGRVLASFREVTAMLDVSDGIFSDIRHIMDRSGTGAKIVTEKIPISPQLQRIAAIENWDTLKLALGSGEDYCLLATVNKDTFDLVTKEFEKEIGHPLYCIGEITNTGELELIEHNKKIHPLQSGFDHFR